MFRIGVIGFGNMGQKYYEELLAGMVEDACVTAVYSGSPEKRKRLAKGMAAATVAELLDRKDVDGVMIAAPNHTHEEISRAALNKGKHVLVEKPVGLNLNGVEELNQLARQSGLCFGVMFQTRVHPLFVEIKRALKEELGTVERIHWQVTQYYRPQSYYNGSRSWNGSFQSDGGGILLNQAIHQLDLWQFLFGMPDEVASSVRFGGFRDIEVDDQATAIFRYQSGLTGVFMATVNEQASEDRLEIIGSQGKILLTGQKLQIQTEGVIRRLECSGFDHWQASRMRILKNFVNGVTRGEKLISSGEDGLLSLELVFAVWQSTWSHRFITLPIDREEFERQYQERCR